MLDDILLLTKQLNVKDDKIKIAAGNLKLLSQVKGRLQKILLNPTYVQSVKDYVGNFNEVIKLQNNYFREIESKFSPPKLVTEIKKQAVESVVNNLTENGLNANIVDKVHNLMRQAATSGGSYNTLNTQLTDFITNNHTGDGQLLRYTKQITTDALNQFSGQYTQLISADLGFEWFRYSGSNIETTRPFCLACTDRKYFHISEMPKVLLGEFEEFRKYQGKINKKTGLPEGMIPGTDVSNFQTNRGGYNCGHQWRPVSADLVPMDIQQRVYATPEYKTWARANGKKVIEPAPVEKENPPPVVTKKEAVPEKTNIAFQPPAAGKKLFVDPTLLVSSIDKIYNAVTKKIRESEIKKLKGIDGMKKIYVNHDNDNEVHLPDDRIISVAEKQTAIKMTDAAYEIIFTSKGQFKRGDKQFDAYTIDQRTKKINNADFKENKTGTPNSIFKNFESAAKQADNLVIDLVTKMTKTDLIEGLRLGRRNFKEIKFIVILYRNNAYKFPANYIDNEKYLSKEVLGKFQ